MAIRMTKKAEYPLGEAHVLPEDQATWEAAGWVVDPLPENPKTTDKEPKK